MEVTTIGLDLAKNVSEAHGMALCWKCWSKKIWTAKLEK